MKNIGVSGQKVKPENLIFFGVRDTEEPEDKQIEKLNIKNYMVHEVRYRGLRTCVNEALNQLSNCDVLYISFDVDSMDCDMVSYGTGTPVPKGFDPQEIKDIINMLLESKKVACLEFVEVNPLLDLIKGQGYQGGPVVALFNKSDKATVLEMLNSKEVKAVLPAEMKFVKFMFGKETKDNELVELYAIKGNREDTVSYTHLTLPTSDLV